MDLFGPKSVVSLRGEAACLIRDCCYTRFTCIHIPRNKSEAVKCFKTFVYDVSTDGLPSKNHICDASGGESSVNGLFGLLCRDRGIKQELNSVVHTPQRNAVTERAISML